MEYVLSSLEMKKADAYTIQNYTPSIELMEKAGVGSFNIIKNYINKKDKILVVAGPGGNGGDGLVIARLLHEENYDVSVYLKEGHYKEETIKNKNLYHGKFIADFNANEYDVIIDALLGVGINSKLRDDYLSLIKKMNDNKEDSFKVSIDVNSGIDASTGFNLGDVFHSDLTIAINNYKLGHYFNDGINAYKNLIKLDIDIKTNEIDDGTLVKTLEISDLKDLFKTRDRNSNKGTYGKVALIGGSKLTPGALLLSSNALSSLRMGVGYSLIAIPSSLYNIYALKNLENIYSLLSDDGSGHIIYNEEDYLKLLNYDAIAIGMGIGVSEEVYKLINYFLRNYKGNLLLDADALNSLSRYGVDILKDYKPNKVIITPHLKEFSRLTNLTIDQIKENYIGFAKDFALKYNLIVNLKNDISVITDGKESYLNINGNAGLAKGGSGDVLSGITLGLLNKKDNLTFRVASGSFILGRSSELAIKKTNEYSLIGSDVINEINNVIFEIKKS